MSSERVTFGASFGEIFRSGVRGFVAQPVPLAAAALLTLATYLAFRFPAQAALDDGRTLTSIGFDLVGLVVASIVAYPWYSYALSAADGTTIDVRLPFRRRDRFGTQAVASFWFWAGVLLGFRYLYGIPAILVVVFYAFYGFVVADGVDSGLKALGTSVRLGEGRRIGLAALAGVFFFFNLMGAIALGFAVNALTIVLALIGLVITTNITMISGARLYRIVQDGVESVKAAS